MAANKDIVMNAKKKISKAKKKLARKFYADYGSLLSQLEDIYTMSFVRQDGSQQEAPVVDKIWELFLENPRKPLWLLGDAGMGKTSAGLQVWKRMWEYAEADEDYPMPLYIHLPQYSENLRTRLLWRVFEDAHLSPDEHMAMESHPLFLVLDGFDEVSIEHDIYRTQGWGQNNLKIGMLVCCRPEALMNKSTEILFEKAEKLYLQSFNDKQIEIYLEQYLAKTREDASAAPGKGKEKDNDLTAKEYLDQLENLPSLKALVKTPFLLSVAAQSLPEIICNASKDEKNEISQRQFTQNELFRRFLSDWFEKQAAKVEIQGSLSGLGHKAIAGYMHAYAKNLASSRIKADGTLGEELITDEESLKFEFIEPVHDGELLALYHDPEAHKKHSRFFFKEENGIRKPIKENIRIIRSGCLFHTLDERFRFLHKSIVEYLAAQELMEGFLGNCDRYLESLLSHKKDVELGLNRTLLKDSSTISRLAEEVNTNRQFKELLRKVLYDSKEIPKLGTAAANAITILNYAGVDFSGEDLSEVQIHGANLSNGIFVGTIFNGADLTDVCFRRANLNNALWRGAWVKDVDFGDEMYLSLPAEIRAFMSDYPGSKTMEMQVIGKDNRVYVLNLNNLDYNKKPIAKNLYFPFLSSSRSSIELIILGVWKGLCWLLFCICCGGMLYWFLSDERQRNRICSQELISLLNVPKIFLIIPYLGFIFVSFLLKTFSYDDKFMINLSEYLSLGCEFVVKLLLLPSLYLLLVSFYGRVLYGIISCFMNLPVSFLCNLEKNLLISGYADGTIRIWLDVDVITEVGAKFPYISPWDRWIILSGHTNSVVSFACTFNNTLIASGSKDKTIRLWQLPEGKFALLLPGHEGSVTSLSFAHSQQRLASGSEDRTVRLWRLPEGKEALLLRGHEGTVTSLVFTPDERWLVSGSEDETIRLWQLPTGTAGLMLRGDQGTITTLAVIPDSKILMSASGSTIRFWKAWEDPLISQYNDKKKIKLCLQGLDITEALDLSPANQALCNQRGSRSKPNRIGKPYQAWCNLFQPIPGTGHCQSQPSLIRVGSQRFISENIWVLSVARQIRSNSNQWFYSLRAYDPTNSDNHGFLILEGIKNHRRFIIRAELNAVMGWDVRKWDVQITLKPLDDWNRFEESAKNFKANQYAIDCGKGEQLLRNIRADQQRIIRYNPLGGTNANSSSSQISAIDSYNCWSWCLKQMELIDIEVDEKKLTLITLARDVITEESDKEGSSCLAASMQKN